MSSSVPIAAEGQPMSRQALLEMLQSFQQSPQAACADANTHLTASSVYTWLRQLLSNNHALLRQLLEQDKVVALMSMSIRNVLQLPQTEAPTGQSCLMTLDTTEHLFNGLSGAMYGWRCLADSPDTQAQIAAQIVESGLLPSMAAACSRYATQLERRRLPLPPPPQQQQQQKEEEEAGQHPQEVVGGVTSLPTDLSAHTDVNRTHRFAARLLRVWRHVSYAWPDSARALVSQDFMPTVLPAVRLAAAVLHVQCQTEETGSGIISSSSSSSSSSNSGADNTTRTECFEVILNAQRLACILTYGKLDPGSAVQLQLLSVPAVHQLLIADLAAVAQQVHTLQQGRPAAAAGTGSSSSSSRVATAQEQLEEVPSHHTDLLQAMGLNAAHWNSMDVGERPEVSVYRAIFGAAKVWEFVQNASKVSSNSSTGAPGSGAGSSAGSGSDRSDRSGESAAPEASGSESSSCTASTSTSSSSSSSSQLKDLLPGHLVAPVLLVVLELMALQPTRRVLNAGLICMNVLAKPFVDAACQVNVEQGAVDHTAAAAAATTTGDPAASAEASVHMLEQQLLTVLAAPLLKVVGAMEDGRPQQRLMLGLYGNMLAVVEQAAGINDERQSAAFLQHPEQCSRAMEATVRAAAFHTSRRVIPLSATRALARQLTCMCFAAHNAADTSTQTAPAAATGSAQLQPTFFSALVSVLKCGVAVDMDTCPTNIHCLAGNVAIACGARQPAGTAGSSVGCTAAGQSQQQPNSSSSSSSTTAPSQQVSNDAAASMLPLLVLSARSLHVMASSLQACITTRQRTGSSSSGTTGQQPLLPEPTAAGNAAGSSTATACQGNSQLPDPNPTALEGAKEQFDYAQLLQKQHELVYWLGQQLPGLGLLPGDTSGAAMQQLMQQQGEVQEMAVQLLQQWRVDAVSVTLSDDQDDASPAAAMQQVLQVSQQMLGFAAAVCVQLPLPLCCNNPACDNMAGLSEQQLVGGKACICGGCKVARYCSSTCQEVHWWQGHKRVCKRLKIAAGTAG